MAVEGTKASCARDLGQGWKVFPSVRIEAGQTYMLADIDGPGTIQSMWLSGDVAAKGPLSRFYILRELPPACCDFFASGWGQFAARGRESEPWLQLFLGDAVPQAMPHHAREPPPRVHDPLLLD